MATIDSNNTASEPMMAEEGNIQTELPPVPCHTKVYYWLKDNLLLVLTVLGVTLGTLLGFAGRHAEFSEDAIVLVSMPGELLMRMLKMLILPLIISSIISGLSQLDARASSRMGSMAMAYYVTTTLFATSIGIACVLIIHPGNPHMDLGKSGGHESDQNVSSLDAFLDLLRNLFPDNLVRACLQQIHTIYVPAEKVVISSVEKVNTTIANISQVNGSLAANGTKIANYTQNDDITAPSIATIMVRQLEYRDGMNVLGLIIFCVVFGTLLGRMGEQARVMTQFFGILNDLVMQMVQLVMWYAPVGIMFLIAGKILSIDNLITTASQLGMYMITVVTGLTIHCIIIIPLIYLVVTKKNPFTYFRGIMQAWVTALATASSAATLPITVRCVEENNGVDGRVTRFILPLGATVNMDGSALYEAVTAIFIAQLNGITLGAGQVVTVSMVATLASIGNASVPHAALVTILLVLTAIGLPTEDVGLVFAVDWILDRVRTAVNVQGDAFGAGILHHMIQKDLHKFDTKPTDRRISKDIQMEEIHDHKHKHEKYNHYDLEVDQDSVEVPVEVDDLSNNCRHSMWDQRRI